MPDIVKEFIESEIELFKTSIKSNPLLDNLFKLNGRVHINDDPSESTCSSYDFLFRVCIPFSDYLNCEPTIENSEVPQISITWTESRCHITTSIKYSEVDVDDTITVLRMLYTNLRKIGGPSSLTKEEYIKRLSKAYNEVTESLKTVLSQQVEDLKDSVVFGDQMLDFINKHS